jgi:hypothetical protein
MQSRQVVEWQLFRDKGSSYDSIPLTGWHMPTVVESSLCLVCGIDIAGNSQQTHLHPWIM